MAEQNPEQKQDFAGETQVQAGRNTGSAGQRPNRYAFMLGPKFLALVVLLISAIGLVGYFILRTSVEDYQPLFTNLDGSDASLILSRLEKDHIPYTITQNGQTILVPPDKVLRLRMTFAGEGIPQGTGVGFEIFDSKNIGMTEFTQKLNYQRAIQGELARTINSIDAIEKSRVHIVLPEKSLFMEEVSKPTASIVLMVKPGRILSDNQIVGISNLVASSVEGLDPEQISIVDQHGKMLNKGTGGEFSKLNASLLEYQENVEKLYAEKIQNMLGQVLGAGNVIARVTAEVDFERVEKTEERYDPDSAVPKSETRTSEKFEGNRYQASGVPGSANLENKDDKQVSGNSSDRINEKITYEINKETTKTVKPFGKIQKLTVAVMVNVKARKPGDNKSIEKRTDEEKAELDALVKSAIGYNTDRKDEVVIREIPFKVTDYSETDKMLSEQKYWERVSYFAKLGGLILLALLTIFFVVRPIVSWLTLNISLKEDEHTVEEKPLDAAEALNKNIEDKKNSIRELAMKDPEKTVQALRGWLTT